MRSIVCCLAVLGFVGLYRVGGVIGAEPPTVKTAPKKVFVFKNGLGFVIASGEAKLQDGAAELGSLPAAALGALWFSTDRADQRIVEVSSITRDAKVPTAALNMVELLRANIGRSARVTYYLASAEGGFRTVDAEILSVPEDRSPAPPDAAEVNPFFSSRSRWNATPSGERVANELVVLRYSGGRILALNRHSIQSVEFSEAELNTDIARPITRTRLRFEGQAENATINMMYLEKGWNWSPSYLIDIQNEKTANLTLDAVLANDAADLENAEIAFVVGYPNFAFANVAHPLASSQAIAEFVQSLLAQQRGDNQVNYGIMAQNAVSYSNATAGPAFSPADLAQANGNSGSEDLFFFNRPQVTLVKSGRARFNLLNQEVPYEHIYEWRLGEPTKRRDGYQPNPEPPEKQNEVWHTIRVRNTGREPWTTAPAIAVNGQLPVAQDTLKYTPAGASSSVRITVASDIRARETLEELTREPVQIAGREYVRISVQSSLTLQNFKKSAAKIVFHRTVDGEVTDAGAATERRAATNLTAINPTRELEWELELAPGAERALEFRYTTVLYR